MRKQSGITLTGALMGMIVAAFICFLPGLPRVGLAFERATTREDEHLVPATVLGLVLLVLSFFSLANSAYNPFIYFRF